MKKIKAPAKKNIFALLNELKDYRRKQGVRHPLQTILLITIMGIMSGGRSERAVVRFAKNNKKDLVNLLKIKRNEVPSKSVISSLVQNTDFKKLEKIFYKWSLQFVSIKKGERLGIDGKAIRGTVSNPNDKMQDFVSLVTVFLNKKKQVLTVGKINTKKENEIPKVKELIEMLDLQGVCFTLDALHCQKETVKTIVKSKNDYVIGVKENQKNLLKTLKKTAKTKKV